MAEIYYYIDSNTTNTYVTNEPKGGYSLWEPGTSTHSDGRVVNVELYNDKFILPSDCSRLFYKAANTSFDNTEKWDTSEATTFTEMFYYCSGITTLDVKYWDMSSAVDMTSMFERCYYLNYIYALPGTDWSTTGATGTDMFKDCSRLKGYKRKILGQTWTGGGINNANNLTPAGYFSGYNGPARAYWRYENTTSSSSAILLSNEPMPITDGSSATWAECDDSTHNNYIISSVGTGTYRNLKIQLIDGKFKLPEVCPDCLFGYSNNVTNIDKVDSSGCKDFYGMFSNTKMTSIDISNWDFTNAEDLSSFCFSCSSLETFILPEGDFSNVKKMDRFLTHSKVRSIDLSIFKNSPIESLNNGLFQNSYMTVTYLPFEDYSNLYDVESCFSNCNNLEHIYVKPGTNWAVGTNLPRTSEGVLIDKKMFGPLTEGGTSKLPNFTPTDMTQNRANTIMGFGYFENTPSQKNVFERFNNAWVAVDVYEKYEGTWLITTAYLKDSEWEA